LQKYRSKNPKFRNRNMNRKNQIVFRKYRILNQKSNVWSKFEFSVKNRFLFVEDRIFCQKSNFPSTIEFFVKNRIFRQKSIFSPKINFFNQKLQNCPAIYQTIYLTRNFLLFFFLYNNAGKY